MRQSLPFGNTPSMEYWFQVQKQCGVWPLSSLVSATHLSLRRVHGQTHLFLSHPTQRCGIQFQRGKHYRANIRSSRIWIREHNDHPLASVWAKLGRERKRKWRTISFPSLASAWSGDRHSRAPLPMPIKQMPCSSTLHSFNFHLGRRHTSGWE